METVWYRLTEVVPETSVVFVVVAHGSFLNSAVKELLKSVPVCQSYRRNIKVAARFDPRGTQQVKISVVVVCLLGAPPVQLSVIVGIGRTAVPLPRRYCCHAANVVVKTFFKS